MDRTVPAAAALLLDFIGDIEAPKGYDTIYGNNQHRLSRPVSAMTLAEIQTAQPGWTNSYGSSATGRYQFMKATLAELIEELGLSRSQKLDADLQDRLAFHLLKRRGYEAFMTGQIGRTEFGRRLAQEWASLPVLATTKGGSRQVLRGQSYYAGDGLNKSLVTPERVEKALDRARAAGANPAVEPPQVASGPSHTPSAEPAVAPGASGFWAALIMSILACFRRT